MEYEIYTYVGNRDLNEDCAGTVKNDKGESCFILADGLGGHGKGEVASKLVVDEIGRLMENCDDMAENRVFALQSAQIALLEKQKKDRVPYGMKTTVVILTVSDRAISWAHIGDSRLYAFQKNKIKFRTLDHSVPQMLVLSGEIKEKQIRNHPDRNRLLKVMGVQWNGTPFTLSEIEDPSEYQGFLLCSDGFWELIEDKMMAKLLKKSKSPAQWIQLMSEVVMKNGKKRDMDNCTAIAVWL